jgi:hypothetical protein
MRHPGIGLHDLQPKGEPLLEAVSGDYVCCSAGDSYTPPKPDPPQQNPDGTCTSHLIQNTDTCA